MSVKTTPAFVHNSTWNADTRAHPATAWMEKYTLEYDQAKWDSDPNILHAKSFTLYKADGTIVSGAEAGWADLRKTYGAFARYHHEPQRAITYETAEGWEMVGLAKVYFELPGEASGEKNVVRDESGPEGIKLGATSIFADSMPAMGMMLQRGLVKPQDLGL